SALLPEPGQTTAGQENYLAVAQLIDRSIGNSGDYENYYAVNGVDYNHLIDPDTLMPATTYRGVSVFTDDCAMADLLSSTLFLLPYAEGRALVESLAGVDAIWIYTGGRVEMTSGISAALSTRPPNT
ncbi:MAG TPA: FAD:protein FMN transferase, partial [Clostridia bacterium]